MKTGELKRRVLGRGRVVGENAAATFGRKNGMRTATAGLQSGRGGEMTEWGRKTYDIEKLMIAASVLVTGTDTGSGVAAGVRTAESMKVIGAERGMETEMDMIYTIGGQGGSEI
jgi:hypothetical protein